MKILVISDFNIGGQCTALAKAINTYTNHEARCIIANDDSFAYDSDILLSRDGTEEAAKLANEWADFYHFGSYIFNWPGVDFNNLVKKRNCCIKYYGSYLRDNGQRCREFHERTGIAAITGTDFTITGLLGQSFYHLGSYFVKYGKLGGTIPYCDEYIPGEGPLRICAGSAGHPNKGYGVLVDTINTMIKDGYPVELDMISGVSNSECLERKLRAHATFCSFNGGWGISGIESMFMGHVVLTTLDPFVLSLYPDQPALLVDKHILAAQIEKLIKGNIWERLSRRSREFAILNFRWELLIAKYMYVIDLIQNYDAYLKGGRLPDAVYSWPYTLDEV